MNFKTKEEAFNYWNGKTLAEIEERSQNIIIEVETNPEADIEVLNVEVEGLAEAKENLEEKRNKFKEDITNTFNPITGTNEQNKGAKKTMTDTIFETKEYRSAFYKDILGHALSKEERNAMDQAKVEMRAFNIASDNANVIPTHTLNEVVRKARTQGGLLAEARGFNMPANFDIPIGTPMTKAEWHTEGAEVEGDKAVTTKVTFSANEIVKVFSISTKARKMSVPAFEQYITDELVASVMETIEYSLVNGTGATGQGTGITSVTFSEETNNLVEFSTTPAYTDFTKALALLKRGYANGAKWAMNNATLYNIVYSLVDSNKRPIFIADPKAESVGMILGKPVIIDDNIEDGDIYLGNYNYLGYNLPDGITIEVSTESSFKQNLIDFKATALADTKVILPEAFVKLEVPTP